MSQSHRVAELEREIKRELAFIQLGLVKVLFLTERLFELIPRPIAGMKITITGDNMNLKAKKAGLDFQLADNGTATATLSFTDAAGLPTTLPSGSTAVSTWTSSDPGVVVTGSADGLSASVTPSTPPVLVAEALISVSTVVTNSDSTTETFTAATPAGDGVSVVAGGPAGMQISIA